MYTSPIPLAKLLYAAIRRLFADESTPLAGNIAFRLLFSVFPFLIFLTTLAGFFGNEKLATQVVDYLFTVAPDNLAQTLSPEIHSILTVPRTGVLSLSVLLTIWSAMGGVDSVRLALNRAYGVKDRRNFFHIYALLVVFVLGAAFILLAVAMLLVVMPIALAWLDEISPGIAQHFVTLQFSRFPIAILLLMAGLILAHRFLPARELRLGEIMPGVIFTILAWIVMAIVFSYYLATFNTFALTYASLSGLFALMFFFYLAALVLILGGEVNRVVQNMRAAALSAEAGNR